MSDELFSPEAVASDSPRLRWMKRHQVVMFHAPSSGAWYAGLWEWYPTIRTAAEFFLKETGENGASRCGYAETEDDAIADLALKHGLKLWNEEGA